MNSFPKDRIEIVLLEGVHPSAVAAFNDDGYATITRHAKALQGRALVDAVKDAHIIGIRSRTHLTGDVLASARRLITVGCFCIGIDQVDLGAAAERGIPVFNAPFSNTRSV